MDLPKIKFILDENIPIKLKRLFLEYKLESKPIKELGWCGFKDKAIIPRIKEINCIFITRDKDFTFLWRKHQLKVIYLAIEPAILNVIEIRLRELLNNWEYSVVKPFLIIVQNDSIRFWQKQISSC